MSKGKLGCCEPVACRRYGLAWNHKSQLVSEIIHKYALKYPIFEFVSAEVGKVISLFPMKTNLPKKPLSSYSLNLNKPSRSGK